jgi:hypothetical protein
MPFCIGIYVEGAVPVSPGALFCFCVVVHSPPAADDHLDVLGGAGPAHREQPLFGLGRRHTRECPHLGIGQLTAGERPGQPRQRAERARHADVLASGAWFEADAP